MTASAPGVGGLPVQGFVLAGGKSSRMGQDKALLAFCGRPLVEIAVNTLRSVCATVAIAGNRDDLREFAPVVREARLEIGPAAGLEAGLRAATEPWSLFVPTDVPLLPGDLLRRWADAVLARAQTGVRLSYLRAAGQRHAAICLLHRDCRDGVVRAVEDGTYKLGRIFEQAARECAARAGADGEASALWLADAGEFATADQRGRLEQLFRNVNTPEELAAAQAWAVETSGGA